jgi:hypothetical protein
MRMILMWNVVHMLLKIWAASFVLKCLCRRIGGWSSWDWNRCSRKGASPHAVTCGAKPLSSRPSSSASSNLDDPLPPKNFCTHSILSASCSKLVQHSNKCVFLTEYLFAAKLSLFIILHLLYCCMYYNMQFWCWANMGRYSTYHERLIFVYIRKLLLFHGNLIDRAVFRNALMFKRRTTFFFNNSDVCVKDGILYPSYAVGCY